jgi:hypothetical protein
MRASGVTWRFISGKWYMVCEFCGGNCGQCGLTGYVDQIPASMVQMAKNIGTK